MSKITNKYIVKYKESDKPNKWRYFQSFYKSVIDGKDKIENSYRNEKAKKLNYKNGEKVINRINRIYSKCQYHSVSYPRLKVVGFLALFKLNITTKLSFSTETYFYNVRQILKYF